MASLAAVAELAAALNQTIAPNDASALQALATASGVIRNYTQQQIDLVEDDTVVLDALGGTTLFLPELPVVAVSAVSEKGTDLVVTDDFLFTRWGALSRVNRPWLSGQQIVSVTYDHGYAEIPDDVKGVCLAIAGRLYGSARPVVSATGVSGIANEQLGQYQTSYQAPSSPNAAFWGAGAAWLLLPSEKALLDRYRVKGLA